MMWSECMETWSIILLPPRLWNCRWWWTWTHGNRGTVVFISFVGWGKQVFLLMEQAQRRTERTSANGICLGVGLCATSPPCWDTICLELVQVLGILSRSLYILCILSAMFAKHWFLKRKLHFCPMWLQWEDGQVCIRKGCLDLDLLTMRTHFLCKLLTLRDFCYSSSNRLR